MSKKTVGNKGKGKKGGEGVLTPDDFLKAVDLVSEGKGSYFRISTLSLKTKVPFVFEVRSIDQSLFLPLNTKNTSTGLRNASCNLI